MSYPPDCYVLGLQEIDQTQVAVVGGKSAQLGELSRIEGIHVPVGFCVTTGAFRRVMADVPSINDRLDQLSRMMPDDRDAIRNLSAEIRSRVEGIPLPEDLAAAITRALTRLGEQAGYAVRSSATAEDLPTASAAGQQDTYLNVVGPAAILQHVSRCWASLFTERAVTYRLRNGIDHRTVQMAVVVQQMVFPDAAGILFTADPATVNQGATQTVRGRNWPVFENCSRTIRASVRSDQNSAPIAQRHINDNGRFTFRWIPRNKNIGPGRWRLVVRMRCESGRDGSTFFVTAGTAIRVRP